MATPTAARRPRNPLDEAYRLARQAGLILFDRPSGRDHCYVLCRRVGMRRVPIGTRSNPTDILALVRKASGSH